MYYHLNVHFTLGPISPAACLFSVVDIVGWILEFAIPRTQDFFSKALLGVFAAGRGRSTKGPLDGDPTVAFSLENPPLNPHALPTRVHRSVTFFLLDGEEGPDSRLFYSGCRQISTAKRDPFGWMHVLGLVAWWGGR